MSIKKQVTRFIAASVSAPMNAQQHSDLMVDILTVHMDAKLDSFCEATAWDILVDHVEGYDIERERDLAAADSWEDDDGLYHGRRGQYQDAAELSDDYTDYSMRKGEMGLM